MDNEKQLQISQYNLKNDEIICTKDEIDDIHKNVIELNQITRELGSLITSQNEQIDLIEFNTEETQITMNNAKKELDKIEKYNKSRKRHKLALSLVGFTTGATLLPTVGPILGLGKLVALAVGGLTGGIAPLLL
jgi:hypothetical protein